jgi:hypothetical protein
LLSTNRIVRFSSSIEIDLKLKAAISGSSAETLATNHPAEVLLHELDFPEHLSHQYSDSKPNPFWKHRRTIELSEVTLFNKIKFFIYSFIFNIHTITTL